MKKPDGGSMKGLAFIKVLVFAVCRSKHDILAPLICKPSCLWAAGCAFCQHASIVAAAHPYSSGSNAHVHNQLIV